MKVFLMKIETKGNFNRAKLPNNLLNRFLGKRKKNRYLSDMLPPTEHIGVSVYSIYTRPKIEKARQQKRRLDWRLLCG